ncbi:MAG: alkaline shock response membrane anchor protein AmaP [Anaerolineae bacterium]|nr:alkaline shock response membrane anchor protein AmaP [Anaerolineae bacterium]
MNIFNRIIMILAILIGLALAIFLMLQPLTVVDFVRTWIEVFAESIFDDQFFLIYEIALGVLAFVLVLLLWGEIRRGRRKTVRIRTKDGRVRLGVQSVIESLEYRIDELAGVRKVQSKVRSRGGDVEVAIDLDTSPSVNVPVLTSQITQLVRDIVEGQLGVKIRGKVQVNVRHEPYPRGTMPSTGPLGGEALSTPPGPEPEAVSEELRKAGAPSLSAEPSAAASEQGEAGAPEPETTRNKKA